nr:immunoglobulin light chain junction region [Macaca mulatta]MOW01325.1 immunoglobulin light chain junction region [Macaca mulatta]
DYYCMIWNSNVWLF